MSNYVIMSTYQDFSESLAHREEPGLLVKPPSASYNRVQAQPLRHFFPTLTPIQAPTGPPSLRKADFNFLHTIHHMGFNLWFTVTSLLTGI